jgi:integrase
MSRRKPNRRSSIYPGSDGWWHGYVTMGVKDDGSPDRRHVRGKSEAAVTRKVRGLERRRDTGQVDKPGRAPTVETWMATYLDKICARLVATGKMAPRTLDDYRSKTRTWIVPGLGKHRLDRLAPEHLDTLYAQMAAAGKAESHILKVHRILSRALKIAVRRGQVGRNVAGLVESPGAGEIEIKPLTQDEARRLLDLASRRRSGARWIVGLALGLRQGEALGLRWSYLDLDAGEVKIWWQLQRTPWRHGCDDPRVCTEGKHRRACPPDCPKAKRRSGRRHKCIAPDRPRLCPPDCMRHASTCPQRQGGGLVFRPPKGRNKRVGALPPQLIPVLRAHREVQDLERMVAGDAWAQHDLVFARSNGRPIDPRDDYDDWRDLLKAASVRDARLHDGRHTAGTLLIEMGVHVRTVQEILGHSDIRVTQRYTHVSSAVAKDAAERMGRALWGGELG